MSVLANRPWWKRLGLAAAVLLCLGAVSLPAKPADARVFFSVGFPFPAFYAPPVPYYPVPVVYGPRCGWGWHWAPPHWSRWRGWVPGHCRPNW